MQIEAEIDHLKRERERERERLNDETMDVMWSLKNDVKLLLLSIRARIQIAIILKIVILKAKKNKKNFFFFFET